MERNMIPRGLCITKLPTTTYSPEFTNAWNSVVSKCSFDLIQLIIQYEEVKLSEMEGKINELQTSIDTNFSSHNDFKRL